MMNFGHFDLISEQIPIWNQGQKFSFFPAGSNSRLKVVLAAITSKISDPKFRISVRGFKTENSYECDDSKIKNSKSK